MVVLHRKITVVHHTPAELIRGLSYGAYDLAGKPVPTLRYAALRVRIMR